MAVSFKDKNKAFLSENAMATSLNALPRQKLVQCINVALFTNDINIYNLAKDVISMFRYLYIHLYKGEKQPSERLNNLGLR